MALPHFDDLPFNARPDLTPYLIHLTKNTVAQDEYTAFQNLESILRTGKIWGSKPGTGHIKGHNRAACFMDTPFQALKFILTPENADPQKPRYEPYGIVLTKEWAYNAGCRPVLYLSNDEINQLKIPMTELWRVVRFEVIEDGWISWMHEREWRCKGSFTLPGRIQAVLVKNTSDARRLSKLLAKEPDKFACRPSSIIPLTVVSQGLLCS